MVLSPPAYDAQRNCQQHIGLCCPLPRYFSFLKRDTTGPRHSSFSGSWETPRASRPTGSAPSSPPPSWIGRLISSHSQQSTFPSLPADARHFDRWIALFEATARELCPPNAADYFVARVRRIAESLELSSRGNFLRKGERLAAWAHRTLNLVRYAVPLNGAERS